MKRFSIIYIFALLSAASFGQQIILPENDARQYLSDSVHIIPKKPFRAIAETFGTNMVVWGFNRFIMNEDFAKIGIRSFRQNLKSSPVWDTNKFSTNLIAHPYHGSLYFNAARSNGISFWGSIPFTLGGSLMWEYFMETELPSINDLFATSFGGVELGEITFRLSDLFIDNRSSGKERVGREVLVLCISPIRGINRLITGDSWKKERTKGRSFDDVPVYFNLYAGPRFLAEQERSKDGEYSINVGFNLIYGDPFDESRNDYYSPYEWFIANASADLFSYQPLVTQVNAIGILWGKNIRNKKKHSLTAGLFQHFDYYDSQIKNKEKEKVAPYRISEAVAFGGGLLYFREATENRPVAVRSSTYLNAIILGGSLTDHYFNDERDYNLGSGYSVKVYTNLTYKEKISFDLQTENYHIFTWKGDNPDGTGKIHQSVQGDVGNSRLIVFTTQLSYFSGKKWSISFKNRLFTRLTYYKYYKDTSYSTSDKMLTFGYTL
ncbi:MAG: DUF3943 domain-containing protein [Tannerella sp.]|nr:DUF3943 domain-containing protein [Tannerella sp.]